MCNKCQMDMELRARETGVPDGFGVGNCLPDTIQGAQEPAPLNQTFLSMVLPFTWTVKHTALH